MLNKKKKRKKSTILIHYSFIYNNFEDDSFLRLMIFSQHASSSVITDLRFIVQYIKVHSNFIRQQISKIVVIY